MKILTHNKFFFLLIDLVLIFLFAGIGRRSHGEGLQGILLTAAPFVLAVLLAWIIPAVHRVPQRIFPAGILVWLIAVFGGQLLRVLMGGSTAV
ncbi:MAG: DUF3054 domain-containing protein, partial [Rothia sp. (in: high G+C Gram-positive bacteria)]|nr:DUF3054 domain-containing protein [Rothia sp. (in: high G+C Gram-positive bacteria)]